MRDFVIDIESESGANYDTVRLFWCSFRLTLVDGQLFNNLHVSNDASQRTKWLG